MPKVILCLLASIVFLTGCASLNSTPQATFDSIVVANAAKEADSLEGKTVMDQASSVFAANLVLSAKDPDSSELALKAFRTGRSALDLRCNKFLDALGVANQFAANERRQIGLVGGLVATISGLTGASAKQIAGGAATFSFATSSLDSSANAFLFSDASKSITKLVRDAQKAYLQAISSEVLSVLDYSGAVGLLTGYESLCRPAEIRRLIDDAVASSQVVATSGSGAADQTTSSSGSSPSGLKPPAAPSIAPAAIGEGEERKMQRLRLQSLSITPSVGIKK